MKKILLLCLLMVSMILNAQITLGGGSSMVGKVPIDNFWEYSYSQQIFKKQEINTNAAGNITGLKFYVNPNVNIADASDWVVYLGHTSKSEFASESDWVALSDLTEVYAGTISAVNDVVELTFSVPFPYNNTQNLVVAVDENNPEYNYSEDRAFYVHNLNNVPKSAISTVDYFEDCDPADPNEGELLGYRSVISFIGLTPNAVPSCTNLMYPINNAVLVPISPEISWYASSGATSYKISIGTTPGGSNIVNQQIVSTTSFTPSTPLSLNTTYYVRVVAVGAGGESSGCFETKFTTTPPPPSNDECAAAITLTVNPDLSCSAVTAGTTIAATNSGLDTDPCYGAADDDVWYKFTATEASHIISLRNVTSVGSEFDDSAYFQVLSGDCTGLANVLCSSYTGSSVVTGLNVGETYYVRVYSYSEGGEYAQSFNICVGTLPPPPTNDDCATAVTLTVNPSMSCGAVTAGHTLGATDSGVSLDTCSGNPDDDVWFKFTATSAKHVITLSDVVSIGDYNTTDTYFQVFSGDCATGLTNVTCSDPLSKIVDGLTVGTIYYVRVFSYGGTGRAIGFNICVATPPPPPVNDDCSGALIASVFPYSYTQADALGTTNNNGVIDICSDNMNDGTWFTFTGDGTVYDIKVTMPAGIGFDPQIGVYSGTCGNLSCENTVDNAGAGGAETISVSTAAGTVYYVNVGHYDNTDDQAEDVFTITINKESLGTSEVSKAKNEIKVYPNPFADVLNIAKADQVKSVSVTDISGRLVKTIESPSSVLHLGDLKQGLYMLILNMKDGTKQTVKAIKK
ncbi:Por secretion system C-terminal sorting domain [Chryseobacterium nakagawai]|uniref:T9SS C-terminal target domain-containing protein n=2 Tax=Chryseobacterium nakagawai TaxID=1241982 RepID=A0AAD1DSU1_CHRNA|nr:T9SS type A sorting domain-containing protein [Chryseobacterium nakagawai]AZA93171.1 T9SS C-terminal target domain-containing protein [Chryseobacterium nakagawai]VEH19822.1 Por secretion system C-terminal sorting domain [Chryseobacterium nakagawai]